MQPVMRGVAITAVLSSLLLGCADLPETSSTLDGPTFEEWLAKQERLSRSAYLIQGDIVVTDVETLRELYEREVAVGQSLAIHTIAGLRVFWGTTQRANLTYCINTAHFTPSQLAVLVPMLDEAAAAWESGTNVNFIHVTSQDGPGCLPTNNNVMFDVRFHTCALDPAACKPCPRTDGGDCRDPEDPPEPPEEMDPFGMPDCRYPPDVNPDDPAACVRCDTPGIDCNTDFIAGAFFPGQPRAGGLGVGRSLVIGDLTFFTGHSAEMQASVLRHELGHALGFVHEFARGDVTGTQCEESTEHETLTSADLQSIMMYGPTNGCTTFNGQQVAQPTYLSNLDLSGSTRVYGTTFYEVVRPNIAESYAPGSVPGDYDGNGVTDLLVRSGRAGNLWLFGNDGTPFTPRDLRPTSVGSGYGTGGTRAMPGKYHDTQFSDFAIKVDATGEILIDHGYNGLLGWDVSYPGYGGASAIPAPADYDGDGLTDLSIKTTDGIWYIDYSRVSNSGGACAAPPCFGSWNDSFPAYGDGNALPVPADYDGDNRADLAVKSHLGDWFIDFSGDCNRLGAVGNLPCFGAFNAYLRGYGDVNSVPIPADYDGDGHADLAIKTNDGYFAIDLWHPSYPHYHGWNLWPSSGYGDANWTPIPGKYHQGPDDVIDMAQKRKQNNVVDQSVRVDFASNYFGGSDQMLRTRQ